MLQYGQVKRYSSGASNSHAFLFKIDDGFFKYRSSSKVDKKHSLMRKVEVELLNKLLISKNLCLDKGSNPSYVITSKQEKIYDITFANLIEQSYNAKPAAPLTYYGRCV